jgi:Family of unknown function (DUF5946)
MTAEPCSGCGWIVEGGAEGCRARFDELVARDFGDALFFAVHRLFVDTYSVQHPDSFCRSAKSLAAHLAGLCLILEQGASPATGAGFLRRWLDGPGRLEKPVPPARRGAVTLGDVHAIDQPAAWREAVRRWAESAWAAYRDLQPAARRWAAEARRACG